MEDDAVSRQIAVKIGLSGEETGEKNNQSQREINPKWGPEEKGEDTFQ
jgi:hypothetical protein